MLRSLWIAGCLTMIALSAHARFGETKVECMDRYGDSLTNYPGVGDITSVDFYLKGNIVVGLWFIRGSGTSAASEPRVGMIFYSRVKPNETPRVFKHKELPPTLRKEEMDAFLNTTPGRWEDYSPPPSLAGRPDKVIPLTSMPSPTIRNRDAVAETVKNTYERIYPPALRYGGSTVTNLAHNGPKIFACKIGGGLAICSHDSIPALKEWIRYIDQLKDQSGTNLKESLQGF